MAQLQAPEKFVALLDEFVFTHQPGVFEFTKFLDLLDRIRLALCSPFRKQPYRPITKRSEGAYQTGAYDFMKPK